MQTPLISIVMPIYNRSYCVQDAVRSCIDQQFKDWELIVVDDGSKDSDQLVRVLQEFDDERIRYKRIEHTGYISKVRNTGNKMAKADIIVVHDSDDMAFPNRLREIYKTFQDNPDIDIVYHGMYTRLHDEEHNANARGWKPTEKFDKKRLFEKQYIPGQVAYKKDTILKYPYDERIKCCDDWQMLLELALNNCKFFALDKELYEYVYLEDSINVGGEMSGQRKADMEVITDILEKKYNIKAHARMDNHKLLPDEHQGLAESKRKKQ